MEKFIKKIILSFTLLVTNVVMAVIPTQASTIDTVEIIAQGRKSVLDSSCMSWCFTGVCVWLKCGFGCSIKTTPRYKHNNPDLVVTAYDHLGKDPWKEMNMWYSPFQKTAAKTIIGMLTSVSNVGGGHQTEDGTNSIMEDDSLRFKEGSAYGHPFASLGNFTTGMALCPSEAKAFFPYFLSGIDSAEWRFGIGEMGYFKWLLPGMRTVGKGGFFQQWGSVFPRTGFIKQKDDPKAAAVIAQRIGNIVTGSKGIHIASQLKGNGFSWTVLPGELIENNQLTGAWQMLAPKSDPSCYAFGENDVFNPAPWSSGRTTDDNAYVFALWRRYECCRKRGKLIEVISANVCI